MSKRNIAYAITVFILLTYSFIVINYHEFNDVNFVFESSIKHKNYIGDTLVINYLYNNKDYSVSIPFKIDKQNAKIGNFVLLSQLVNNMYNQAIANAWSLNSIDNGNIYAISIISMHYINNKKFKDMDSFIDNLNYTKSNELFLDLVSAWSKAAQGLQDEAFDILDNVNIDSEFEDLYYLHKGMMYETFNNTQKAISNYEKALNEKVSLRTVELLVKLYLRNGNYASADNVIQKYLHIRPESDMGFALKKYVNKMTSSKLTEKTVSFLDGFAQVFFDLAFINQIKSNIDLSLLLSKEAVSIQKDFDFAKLTLASALSNIGQKYFAIDVLNGIEKNSYLYNPAQGYIAEALFNSGEYDKALTLYKSLIEGGSIFNLNYNLKAAQIYEIKHEFENALDLYNFMLSKFSNHNDKRLWILYFKRGVLHHNMKNIVQAEQDLRKAVKMAPNNPVLLNYLGYVLADNDKDLEIALDMLRKAFVFSLNRLPRDPVLLKYLSKIISDKSVKKELLKRGAHSNFDDNSDYIDSLGWALYKDKQYELSIKVLEYGKIVNPTQPFINYHLGEVYLAVGRIYEALYSWKKAVFYNKIDQKLDNVENIIKKIKKYDQVFN